MNVCATLLRHCVFLFLFIHMPFQICFCAFCSLALSLSLILTTFHGVCSSFSNSLLLSLSLSLSLHLPLYPLCLYALCDDQPTLINVCCTTISENQPSKPKTLPTIQRTMNFQTINCHKDGEK